MEMTNRLSSKSDLTYEKISRWDFVKFRKELISQKKFRSIKHQIVYVTYTICNMWDAQRANFYLLNNR